MKETTFKVDGMKCKHCVMTVTEAVSELDGVQSCTVDLAAKTATVKYEDSVADSAIIDAINEEGFQASL